MRHRCVARAAGVPVNAPGSDVNDYRLHHSSRTYLLYTARLFSIF